MEPNGPVQIMAQTSEIALFDRSRMHIYKRCAKGSVDLEPLESRNVTSHSIEKMEIQIKFLQYEYQKLLKSLQLEVETLKQENRALKFQLVFEESDVDVNVQDRHKEKHLKNVISTCKPVTPPTHTNGAAPKHKESTNHLELRKLKIQSEQLANFRYENNKLRKELEYYKGIEKKREESSKKEMKNVIHNFDLTGVKRWDDSQGSQFARRTNLDGKIRVSSRNRGVTPGYNLQDSDGGEKIETNVESFVSDDKLSSSFPKIRYLPKPPPTGRPSSASVRSAKYRLHQTWTTNSIDAHVNLPALSRESGQSLRYKGGIIEETRDKLAGSTPRLPSSAKTTRTTVALPKRPNTSRDNKQGSL